MPDLEHFACKVTDFFADMQIKIVDFYCVGCSRIYWTLIFREKRFKNRRLRTFEIV